MKLGSGNSTLDARSIRRAVVGLIVAGAAIAVAVPATAKNDAPSSSPATNLSVVASAAPAQVLPGETATLVVTVTNTGTSDLPALTLTADLPAAVTYDASSVVATVTNSSGAITAYSGTGTDGATALAQPTPGTLVAPWDAIALAPGDTLRVTFDVRVSDALAPSVNELRLVSLASAGAAASGDSLTLTVLKEALALASDADPAS